MSSNPRSESCPLCGKPADPAHRPFCGQGCKDRDLINWLDEGYRAPGPPADPDAMPSGDDGLDSERQAPL